MTTGSPGSADVTPWPAATSPAASTPATSGSLRLTNAMPRSPQLEVVEADRLDADLHVAGAGRGRVRHVNKLDLAVADECEGAHGLRHGYGVAGSLRGGQTESYVPQSAAMQIE